MKPYEKTTVWVAKIVTDRDEWNTQYMTSPWDNVSIYATRDLAMEAIWKAILETKDYHFGLGAISLEPWRDNPEWEEADLWELAENGFYNEDWLNEDAEDDNFPFREELRFDKWPFPRTFYWITDELEYSLEEMIVHLPPEE